MRMKNKKQAVNETINLYSKVGWKGLFAKIRFWDSPYVLVEQLIPKKGRVVELGSGEGVFSNFLGITSPKREVLGIEIDTKRISVADRGLANVSFRRGDVTKFKIPEADCIVMFHLLHHLNSFKAQEKVIRDSKKSLRKDGKMIIVEIDRKPIIKFLITWFTDYFIVPWLFEGKLLAKKIYFRRRKEWQELLENIGFKAKAFSFHEGKPFSHVVFVCRKK
jgi:2-polyprenyl-3-methyl-5-hydroxy-6-metoxy-1,4-benzoquinol methylase